MKSNYLLLLLAIPFIIFSFTTIQGNGVPSAAIADVGTIKQSIFKPLVFNKSQTGTWVLLQGQELSQNSEMFKMLQENSELNILTLKEGKYYLPDARGKFIRASNVNGQGSDPDKTRLVASVQTDAYKSHTHNGWVGSCAAGNPAESTDRRGACNTAGGNDRYPVNPTTIGISGDVETRPINLTMYTYIKISN